MASSKQPPSQGNVVDVHIQYDLSNGSLRMAGPFSSPVIFAGVMSLATQMMKDTIKAQQHAEDMKKNGNKIIVPQHLPPNLKKL